MLPPSARAAGWYSTVRRRPWTVGAGRPSDYKPPDGSLSGARARVRSGQWARARGYILGSAISQAWLRVVRANFSGAHDMVRAVQVCSRNSKPFSRNRAPHRVTSRFVGFVYPVYELLTQRAIVVRGSASPSGQKLDFRAAIHGWSALPTEQAVSYDNARSFYADLRQLS
eukprot:1165756-Prymnesium_polylepis.1